MTQIKKVRKLSSFYKGLIGTAVISCLYFSLLQILWVAPSLSEAEGNEKNIQIIDNGLRLNTTSIRHTVGEALKDSYFEIYPEDYVKPDMDSPLVSNTVIHIERAYAVTLINFLGEKTFYRTHAATVGDFLNEIKYQKNPDEHFQPAEGTFISAPLTLQAIRRETKEFTEEVSIPYEKDVRRDDQMAYNETKITQKGVKGQKRDLYHLNYENGVLKDKTLIESTVSTEPITEIVITGTKLPEGSTYLTTGTASYYGDAFHGRRTASGDVFDKNELTAAHPTLPFGTMVKVTNLANGKSVIVEITDRGPYAKGRVIDLSEKAFSAVSSLSTGVIKVKLEIVNG